MARGEAGGGKPQGWAPLARQAGASGREYWAERATGRAAGVAWAGAGGEGALAAARRQGAGTAGKEGCSLPPSLHQVLLAGRASLKPGVNARGDPVPRPDLQDVLQLQEVESASAAYQHLQHAVHHGQGL